MLLKIALMIEMSKTSGAEIGFIVCAAIVSALNYKIY